MAYIILATILVEIVLAFTTAPWAMRIKRTGDRAFPYLTLMVLAVWLDGTWAIVPLVAAVLVWQDQRARDVISAWISAVAVRLESR